ncbi:Acyl-CoA dehydrogenase [Sinosporangium album]|uniref:Acyl-CoA dehydrogenase n=1 Tax=Sinosporangium album TaxID=504805 RepID=A0A1G8EVC5_9ACTN|nr:acyl-CoA dehydrogenase family protein [Sinosporangium album]SDH73856.1 Acyl-CoA dehydrogenase [Sinosporangium album]
MTCESVAWADETRFHELREEVEAFVRGPGEQYAAEIERDRAVPPRLWEDLNERGYLRLVAPEEYGGRGVPFSRYLELLELISMSHASVRMIVHVCNGVWRALDRFANEDQRKKFVLPQIAGGIRVAFTLTESAAGSGADLRSSVVRGGDFYYLSGEKHLITFGVSCDYWLLFARLEGTSGKNGTVALMVDRNASGVTVEAMPDTMGVRGTDHATLVFDRTPVPVAHRLGEEGDGLDVAFGGFLTPSRISVAMTCVGLARRAQELAMEHARSRRTFGKPLSSRQAVAFALAENAADIEAARRLALYAAGQWEQGDPHAGALSSMAKLTAVDMLTRVTDKALQVHGGIGYWESSPIERIYRDARAQRFEEGTNEIQKAVIARELLGTVR